MISHAEHSQPPEHNDDTRTGPDAPTPSVETATGFGKNRQKIPGDVVNRGTADLPDRERSLIRRFHAYYTEQDFTLAEAGKMIGYDQASVSTLFHGKYGAKKDAIIDAIESFFELHDKRSQARKLQFIETKLTRKIWDVCDLAREFQRIAFLFGDMQIGKSEALEAYQRTHNHGSTIYVSVPTGGALMHFLAKLAEVLRISPQLRKADLRRRIIDSFDDRMLLIVDEGHRCIPDSGKSSLPIQTIEFIRELFDEKKCGVVICATNVFRDAMDGTGAVEKLLRQTKRRRLCAMQLPNKPSQWDLNTFAAEYGLPPSEGRARELENTMVEEEALGMWLTLLRMAAKIAGKKQITWNHVLEAHAGLKATES